MQKLHSLRWRRGKTLSGSVKLCAVVLLLTALLTLPTYGGDDASGPIQYSVNLAQPFSTYTMGMKDREWSNSLVKRLKYTGQVIHFVKTTLPLSIDQQVVQGAVYQAVEKPQLFYVVNGDAMLVLGTRWPYSPGVGGFSMHSPKPRDFIVCLNLGGGVPFLSGSRVQKARVEWKGHDYNRFK
jgi:hypothetical protein